MNFFRILQKRFYIERFATNFLNISRKSAVLSFVPLPPLLAVHPLPSLLYVFPAFSLFLFAVFVSYDFSVSWYPLYLSVSLFHIEKVKEVGELKGVPGDREIIGYEDSEEE